MGKCTKKEADGNYEKGSQCKIRMIKMPYYLFFIQVVCSALGFIFLSAYIIPGIDSWVDRQIVTEEELEHDFWVGYRYKQIQECRDRSFGWQIQEINCVKAIELKL